MWTLVLYWCWEPKKSVLPKQTQTIDSIEWDVSSWVTVPDTQWTQTPEVYWD